MATVIDEDQVMFLYKDYTLHPHFLTKFLKGFSNFKKIDFPLV